VSWRKASSAEYVRKATLLLPLQIRIWSHPETDEGPLISWAEVATKEKIYEENCR
jgi:hypothetical protein